MEYISVSRNFSQRGAKVKNVWYYTEYPFYSSIWFIFSISATNRNDRPYPHLWQAEGRDPVPRWRVQYKSSESGHESHLVFRKDFHTIDSTCDHVNILVPLDPLFRFSLFPMGLFFGLFLLLIYFAPRKVPGQPSSADFWSLSWIRTIATYFVILLHVLRTSYLLWTLWCDPDWSPCSGLDTEECWFSSHV